MTMAQQFGFAVSTGEHTKETMDLAFQAALMAAVQRGDERCPTSPSTEMGTRHPIAGYQRDDQ